MVNQETKLREIEQRMRDNAMAIINQATKMDDIKDGAGLTALNGIIQYLQEQKEDLF